MDVSPTGISHSFIYHSQHSAKADWTWCSGNGTDPSFPWSFDGYVSPSQIPSELSQYFQSVVDRPDLCRWPVLQQTDLLWKYGRALGKGVSQTSLFKFQTVSILFLQKYTLASILITICEILIASSTSIHNIVEMTEGLVSDKWQAARVCNNIIARSNVRHSH